MLWTFFVVFFELGFFGLGKIFTKIAIYRYETEKIIYFLNIWPDCKVSNWFY